jgi:phosphoenolpyruvate phosphomutase
LNDAPPSTGWNPGSVAAPPATKFAALRREILSPTLSFLMEAHDGLSAKIVEEAGFRGV